MGEIEVETSGNLEREIEDFRKRLNDEFNVIHARKGNVSITL